MQQLTQQRVWICLQMARLHSASAVQRAWRQYWHGIDPPHVTTVKRNYQKYQQHRTSLNRNEGNSERKISKYCQSSPIFKPQWKKIGKVLWNGNLQKVFQSNCPYGLTTSSVCSNMKTITTPNRPCPRLTFCQQFINTTAQDPQFLSNLVTSDEAVFTMNSEVNTRNVICYSQYGQGLPQDYYVGHKQGAEQLMV